MKAVSRRPSTKSTVMAMDVTEVAEVLKLLDPDNADRNQNFWNMMEQLDTCVAVTICLLC